MCILYMKVWYAWCTFNDTCNTNMLYISWIWLKSSHFQVHLNYSYKKEPVSKLMFVWANSFYLFYYFFVISFLLHDYKLLKQHVVNIFIDCTLISWIEIWKHSGDTIPKTPQNPEAGAWMECRGEDRALGVFTKENYKIYDNSRAQVW